MSVRAGVPREPVRTALARTTPAELVVFAGPSLEGAPSAAHAAHLTLPPVRHGDLSEVLARTVPPRTILIVDGLFGAGHAVTLTEIREALAGGTRIYGCSSTGALRAVEARPLGMIGLGTVFAAYLSGSRTEDENVALLHDDENRPLTAPTVNVDRLCELIEESGAASAVACREFRRQARALHFTDRSFSALRHVARRCFADAAPQEGPHGLDFVLECLRPENRPSWDVKRRDAEAALADIALGLAPADVPADSAPAPGTVDALLAGRS